MFDIVRLGHTVTLALSLMLALGAPSCRVPHAACRQPHSPVQAAVRLPPAAAFRADKLKLGRRLALVLGTAAVATSLHPTALFQTLLASGGAGGGGAGGGSGGGGGGGGARWHGALPAYAEEEEEEEETDFFDEQEENGRGEQPAAGESQEEDGDKFLCEGIKATNLPTGPGIPSKAELFDGLNCQAGAFISRKQLSDDLSSLLSTGLFQNVDANVTPDGAGYIVEFAFREKVWPPMMQFKVAGSTILPPTIEEEVLAEARKSKYTTVRVLAAAKNIVESYYQDRGLTFGTISHFDGMETGQVLAHIIEGEITRVSTVYVQPDGSTSETGSTQPRVVLRELPFRAGDLYNVEDAKKALREIFQLQLFDNVQVVPKPDEADPSKVQVDIVLKERPMKAAEAELEWGVAPGDGGRPDLVSLVPGGSVFFEHRNLQREGRQVFGSVSTSNFLAPQDDLGFKLEYLRPYVRGERDPVKTGLRVGAFNARKLSPVFTGGALSDEVPAVWVDRAGVKATLTETYSRQSRLAYGLVLEEVNCRDESGQPCAQGSKALPSGQLDAGGPPTTHSGTGTDRVLFGQANLTRDTTQFVNGVLVGARDVFTVDSALLTGTGLPLFNRHTASCTRFLPLRDVPKRSAAPPPVLVLHARYGGCLGSLASYDAFTLGGPYSCRGYSVGELGAARRVLETAAELRLPVPRLRTHAYAFLEHCTDLGSSKEVPGNPTAYYRRAGAGACSGVGIKLGAVRAEWVRDMNQGTAALFCRFGERF